MLNLDIFVRKFKDLFVPQENYETKTLHACLMDYKYPVDELTYNDLLLDDFKEQYNKTKTSFGDEVYDHWLRSIKDRDNISQIQKDLLSLNNKEEVILCTKWLKKIGKQNKGNIVTDIWKGFRIDSKIINKVTIIFLVNLTISILLSIFFSKFIIFWIIGFLLINILVFLLTHRDIAKITGSIQYFLKAVTLVKKLDKKTSIDLSLPIPDYKVFNNLYWSGLLFKDGIGGSSSGDLLSIIIDNFRVFFCLEAISYKSTAKFVLKNIPKVREIIYFAGYLDCILNNKNLLETNKITLSNIKETDSITFTELCHPLVKSPVGQSRKINRGMIITGLNMAGKSTFMRSLALNQLLATSFGFAFAKEFETDIYYIASSFRINDKLLESKSRYYAEAERLVELKEEVKDNKKVICFIDEILSGTNSEDRILGSIEILRHFASFKNSLIISATHDNKIAENLTNEYELIYFDGEIEGEKIIFDYKIKDGVVSKRNGLLILKFLGINIETLQR